MEGFYFIWSYHISLQCNITPKNIYWPHNACCPYHWAHLYIAVLPHPQFVDFLWMYNRDLYGYNISTPPPLTTSISYMTIQAETVNKSKSYRYEFKCQACCVPATFCPIIAIACSKRINSGSIEVCLSQREIWGVKNIRHYYGFILRWHDGSRAAIITTKDTLSAQLTNWQAGCKNGSGVQSPCSLHTSTVYPSLPSCIL